MALKINQFIVVLRNSFDENMVEKIEILKEHRKIKKKKQFWCNEYFETFFFFMFQIF